MATKAQIETAARNAGIVATSRVRVDVDAAGNPVPVTVWRFTLAGARCPTELDQLQGETDPELLARAGIAGDTLRTEDAAIKAAPPIGVGSVGKDPA